MKILSKIVFSYFSQFLLTPSSFNKSNFCEIENYIYFDGMAEMVLYCKIIISLLELFLANCFLCMLQTQLVFGYYFSILNLFFSQYATLRKTAE